MDDGSGAEKTQKVEASKTVLIIEDDGLEFAKILWQDKSVKEAGGKNGACVEEVLKACVARLKQLDDEVPCEETKVAAAKVETAIGTLEIRTKRRKKQQVEGTRKPHESTASAV